MNKLLKVLNKFRRPKTVFTRLPKGMRGAVRKVDPVADDIVYPEYTNLKGMNSNQASYWPLSRNRLKFMEYSPIHRMPQKRADRMLQSGAPMRRDDFQVPMIRDINGQKVPDITTRGASYPFLGIPSLEMPFKYTPPAASRFIDYTTPLIIKRYDNTYTTKGVTL